MNPEQVRAANYKQLRRFATTSGIKTTGKAPELRARILRHLGEPPTSSASSSGTDVPDPMPSSSPAGNGGDAQPDLAAAVLAAASELRAGVAEIRGGLADVRKGLTAVAEDLGNVRARVEHFEQRPALSVVQGGTPPAQATARETSSTTHRLSDEHQPPRAAGGNAARYADGHRPGGVQKGAPTGSDGTTTYRLPDGVAPPTSAGGLHLSQTGGPALAPESTEGGTTLRVADELAGQPRPTPPTRSDKRRKKPTVEPDPIPRLADGQRARGTSPEEDLASQILEDVHALRRMIDALPEGDPRKRGALTRWTTVLATVRNLAGHLTEPL